MRQMSNCLSEAKFRQQKMDNKKTKETNSVSCLQIKENAVPVTTKRPYNSVKFPLKVPKFQINMNIEILRIHENNVTTTIFT